MFAFLISDLWNYEYWITSPIAWVLIGFQIWMLVDAIRREEWIWAILILIFSVLTAVLYFFFVYRQSPPPPLPGFELPGVQSRHRIKELEAQIRHLDKAHHYSELGDVYFQQGKVAEARAAYESALERDPGDLDTQSHLGQCLVRMNELEKGRTLLEKVCAENPRHDYGHSLMALAETYMALGETDAAIQTWNRVLEENAYARARVQLAQLLASTGAISQARRLAEDFLADDATAPPFQRRRDKPWFRKARTLLKSLPATE